MTSPSPPKTNADPYWKIGGVLMILNVVLNDAWVIIWQHRANERYAATQEAFIYGLLAGQSIVGGLLAAGLLAGLQWIRWLLWLLVSLGAIYLVYLGQHARPGDPATAEALYAIAGCSLAGWILLLSRRLPAPLRVIGAALAAVPTVLALFSLENLINTN